MATLCVVNDFIFCTIVLNIKRDKSTIINTTNLEGSEFNYPITAPKMPSSDTISTIGGASSGVSEGVARTK